MKIKILPSLLAADIGHLADAAKKAEDTGADALHLDIMDPHFVPNIGMGTAVVEMAKKVVSIPLNVHLMLSQPDQFISNFIEAGADSLLIHVEAECNIPEQLTRIRDMGVRAGIVVNPETSGEMLLSVLDKVDEVLCMTVRPGYGGQSFMPEVLPKIKMIREFAVSHGMDDLDVLVDGGVDLVTGPQCAENGANVLISGTSLYKSADMAADTAKLRETAQERFMAAIS
jgi:ribulose-phosphate 3-epimerase